MALPEFLLNVSTAARALAPPSVTVIGGQLDPSSVAEAIHRADLWFTPSAVKGFVPAEFVLLTDTQRKELTDAVTEFSRLASAQNPKAPVSSEGRERGLNLFRKILQLTDPYLSKYAFGPEHRRVIHALWDVTLKHPGIVTGFDFELRDDSSGAPAVFVWVIIPNEKSDLVLKDAAFREEIRRVSADVTQALARLFPDRWAYISLRSRAEQRELLEEQAEGVDREAA